MFCFSGAICLIHFLSHLPEAAGLFDGLALGYKGGGAEGHADSLDSLEGDQ